MFFIDLYNDAKNIVKKDPAARNIFTVILLYPGFHILIYYRIAHWLYYHKFFFLARFISQLRSFSYWNRNSSWSEDWKKIIYRSWYGSGYWRNCNSR